MHASVHHCVKTAFDPPSYLRHFSVDLKISLATHTNYCLWNFVKHFQFHVEVLVFANYFFFSCFPHYNMIVCDITVSEVRC